MVVVAVAVAVFVLRGRGASDGERAEPLTAEVEASGVDLVGGGRLLIDAKPWGNVASVVDASGVETPLPAERQTPLVLSLDPGRYTVSLAHPELFGDNLSCTVEVSASVGATCRLDLLPVTSEEYWEEVGWWR